MPLQVVKDEFMKPTDHSIFGIVLAAGASQRMGEPKALLATASGKTLLEIQCNMLAKSGCRRVAVVVGADAGTIRKALPALSAELVVNTEWERGQFSSLVAGIRDALSAGADGAIVLPVDAAGIPAEVVTALIETALRNPHLEAVVPEYEGKKGHPVYLSKSFCEALAALDPGQDSARLDAQLKAACNVMGLPVNSPSVVRNINTMDDWKRFSSQT